MFGKFAADGPRERTHAGADRIQGMNNRSHRGVGFTVGDAPHAQEAGFSLDQSDDASEALADDRVTLLVTDPLARVDDGGAPWVMRLPPKR